MLTQIDIFAIELHLNLDISNHKLAREGTLSLYKFDILAIVTTVLSNTSNIIILPMFLLNCYIYPNQLLCL